MQKSIFGWDYVFWILGSGISADGGFFLALFSCSRHWWSKFYLIQSSSVRMTGKFLKLQEVMAQRSHENSSSVRSPSTEKFAPRFDGLRFIETLVTAHRWKLSCLGCFVLLCFSFPSSSLLPLWVSCCLVNSTMGKISTFLLFFPVELLEWEKERKCNVTGFLCLVFSNPQGVLVLLCNKDGKFQQKQIILLG